MQTQDFVPVPAFQSPREADLEIRLNRLRLQLALERLAIFFLRGCLGGSAALILLSAAVWLGAPDVLLWLALVPLVAAVIFSVLQAPTAMEAARAADRRLGLDERLATAAELLNKQPPGRFDALQIRDAVAQPLPRIPLAFTGRTRYELAAAVGALIAAMTCALLVPALPRISAPAQGTSVANDASGQAELAEQALAPEDVQADVPTLAAQARVVTVAPDANRVQQEQAEGSALDKLAQGLSSLSAGQAAADDLRQGNFPAAADELRNLADNADQLSEAAKQQLAQGLQQAASNSAPADPTLARSEQQAAQALARSTYVDQRQALRSLADQIERSGSRSVSNDQLAHDVGQLQQQAAQNGANSGPTSRTSGQQGGPAVSGESQQAGPGVGSGPNPNPYTDQATQLDTTGQRVDVPLKLGQGNGVRPPDGTEDGSVGDPSLSGKSVSQVPQSQQTGQVTPEQNLVPDEQRPVVRGYFR